MASTHIFCRLFFLATVVLIGMVFVPFTFTELVLTNLPHENMGIASSISWIGTKRREERKSEEDERQR